MRFISAAGFVLFNLFSLTASAEDKLPWSYDGVDNGQDSWGQISKDYAKCEIGTRQSPVRISFTTKEDLKPLAFQYKEGKATIGLSNLTIDVAPSGNNMLVADGVNYQLKHIIFHSPSEHTVLDKFYLLEMQLIHEDAEGKQLAIAIFVDSGDDLEGIKPITGNIPAPDSPQKEITLNAALLLPNALGYYAYTGSMTYPPCTENIEWRVLKTPIKMSYKQMDSIIYRIGRNSRLEQAIYGRTIKETNY